MPVYAESNDSEAIYSVACNYLETMPYSKEGLIQTLNEYEYFNVEDIKSVINTMDVNWEKEAERELVYYLDLGGYSEDQLKNNLQRDMYTDAEIEEAIKTVNPNWNKQAQKCVETLKQTGVRNCEIRIMLKAKGFTDAQIDSVVN